jgi:hypothetical protein
MFKHLRLAYAATIASISEQTAALREHTEALNIHASALRYLTDAIRSQNTTLHATEQHTKYLAHAERAGLQRAGHKHDF